MFPEVNAALIPNCAEGGVIPTLAGIIGCMQANEVIKLISGTGESLAGKLLLLDAQTLQSWIINIGAVSKVSVNKLPEAVPVMLLKADEVMKHITDHLIELVDVRSADERSVFHIGGRHIPVELPEQSVASIDAHKPVVFYCATGRRSAEAASIFRRSVPGAQVYSVEGGMKAWQEMMHQRSQMQVG